MRALSFAFAFACLSAYGESTRRFNEDDVIRRERIESTVRGPDAETKIQLEYLIMSNGTLWMRQIADGNLRHLPTLVPLGSYAARDFAPFAGRLFLISTVGDPRGGRFLIELNAAHRQAKPYDWLPETGAFMGASGLALYLACQSLASGHYVMAVFYLAVTGTMGYMASEAACPKSAEQTQFFNSLLRDDQGAPYRVIEVRVDIFNGEIAEVYLQSTSKIVPVRLSQLFPDPNKNCNVDLNSVDSPPLSPN